MAARGAGLPVHRGVASAATTGRPTILCVSGELKPGDLLHMRKLIPPYCKRPELVLLRNPYAPTQFYYLPDPQRTRRSIPLDPQDPARDYEVITQ